MHAVKRTHGSGGTEGAGRVGMEVQGYSLYIDIDEFAEFKFVLDGMLMLE